MKINRVIYIIFILFAIVLFSVNGYSKDLCNTIYLNNALIYPSATKDINNAKTANGIGLDYEKKINDYFLGNIQIGTYKISKISTKVGLLSSTINNENMKVNFAEMGVSYKKNYNAFCIFAGPGIGFYKADYNFSKESNTFGNLETIADNKTEFGYYLLIGSSYPINDNISLRLSLKNSWVNVSYSQDEQKWTFGEKEINDIGGTFVSFGIGYSF